MKNVELMQTIGAIICFIVFFAGIIFSRINVDNLKTNESTEAIKAGLQQCRQDDGVILWQKECK